MKRICVGVCLLVFGCGDDGGGEPVEIDELSTAISTASCNVQFECCSAAEIMEQYMGLTFEGEPITTVEQCITFSTAFFSLFGASRYQMSVDLGRADYDAAAAGDCIAAIEDTTCAEYSTGMVSVDSSCRPFLLPKVGDGGGCTQDYECTSGNCIGEEVPFEGESTDGVCGPIPGLGEECDENCGDGQFCDVDPMTGMETCQNLLADGEICSLDTDCLSDHCTDDNTCGTKPVTCTGA